ncbi:MAG: efflux RND transporter permease subunit [Phycisphaeraceae bacterium]
MSQHAPHNPSPLDPAPQGLVQRIVAVFLHGNLSAMLIALALLAGMVALLVTPREEEPQIVVPMADIHVQVPGASAREIERQVATPLEKMLFQIDGVEYVYSMSQPDRAVVTVRFYVGEDREASLVKLYNKLSMNQDAVPPSVAGWVVKPVEIDDVPIVSVALYADDARYSDVELRQIAEELELRLQRVANAGRTYIIGGRPRQVRVAVDAERLAGHRLSFADLERALRGANVVLPAGDLRKQDRQITVDAGVALSDAQQVRDLVVGVEDGRPIYLRDVADVELTASEVRTFTQFGFGAAADGRGAPLLPPLPSEGEGWGEGDRHTQAAIDNLDTSDLSQPPSPNLSLRRERDLKSHARLPGQLHPAVTVAVAKKKGTNAVWVARDIEAELAAMAPTLLPDGVHYRITRNYGETANHKVNELVESLIVAIIIVVALLALVMGWREGLVVATAVPITFALTLLVNYLAGYTINRVTLFALILALGLVVDDPIVDVENIHRHFKMRKEKPLQAVLTAINEVRPPIILATLAVIISFVPMFFITGMMGPYMRPMALNVPLAMIMSLVVAFTVTPWMAYHVLKGEANKPGHADEGQAYDLHRTWTYRIYAATVQPLLRSRLAAWTMLIAMALLFVGSCLLALTGRVPLKMLPFDNKNELQVVVDMPEGTTLERTDAAVTALATYLQGVAEVTDVSTYVGTASPMDFNGMVRHYYLRQAANVGDIRVNLLPKRSREQQSHAIGLRLRDGLGAIARQYGANISIVEAPPGPPVLQTLVVEVYGQPYHDYTELQNVAQLVQGRLGHELGVVDLDSTIEAQPPRLAFDIDREKAALAGLSQQAIAQALSMAVAGNDITWLHRPDLVYPLPINVRLPHAQRNDTLALSSLYLATPASMVQIGELGDFANAPHQQTVYHKNMRPVVYVSAEMAGRPPAEAVLSAMGDLRPGGSHIPVGFDINWTGEGEWKITVDAFRDLGIAFAAACLGIYLLLVWETGSYFMPLVLMISIPLTVIGIMPGFWLLNLWSNQPVGGFGTPVFFTATAMIGMIALSGIAVRNAILLIDFIHAAVAEGQTLRQAILDSGAVRFRPIFLTAGTSMLAAIPITLDPIFSGLAWALIFGLFVSTAFTLVVIPVVYWMIYQGRVSPVAVTNNVVATGAATPPAPQPS